MTHPQPAPDPRLPERGRSLVAQRLERYQLLARSREAQQLDLELCRRSELYWFDWWVWTFDPRLTAEGKPAVVPFDLYARQRDLTRFLNMRVQRRDDGLVEKSRDIGWTWTAGGWSLHKWLFVPGFKTNWGSRKAEYVDKLGDPDSIFEKIRMVLRNLPPWQLPAGFGDRHDNYMRLINPANGNTLRGEAGDEMGRGGRCTVYLIDEAAHIEHADRVDKATIATADIRIWASSVNGMGNLFARKRHGGRLRPDQIFVFDYRDDPRKTPEWAAQKKRDTEDHVWAAEYERDYSASVEGICIPAKWVQSAVELGELVRSGTLRHPVTGKPVQVEAARHGIGGLDVGAGKAKSVFVGRFGPVITTPIAWGDPDTIETANRALDCATELLLTRTDGYDCRISTLCYDAPGVGAGVQSALNYHTRKGLLTVPVNTGESPTATTWPDGKTSEERFGNLKAEAWFKTRARFKAAHEWLQFLRGEKKPDGTPAGYDHGPSSVAILPPLTAGADVQILVGQLSLVKWFRNESGKYVIETKVQLAKRGIPSPDHADALVLTEAGSGSLEEWEGL